MCVCHCPEENSAAYILPFFFFDHPGEQKSGSHAPLFPPHLSFRWKNELLRGTFEGVKSRNFNNLNGSSRIPSLPGIPRVWVFSVWALHRFSPCFNVLMETQVANLTQ